MRDLFIQAAKYFGAQGGRKGGRATGVLKGFASGDNARKAVAVRWAKYRGAQKKELVK